MTSILEDQPSKTRPFRIKTMVIYVPGIYVYTTIYRWVSKVLYPQIWNRLLHGFSNNAVDFWVRRFFSRRWFFQYFPLLLIILQHSPVILWAEPEGWSFSSKGWSFRKIVSPTSAENDLGSPSFFSFRLVFSRPNKNGPPRVWPPAAW